MSQPTSWFSGKIIWSTGLFTLRAMPRSFVMAAFPALSNKLHPLHKRTTDRYQERLNGLITYTIVPLTIHKSSCVRQRIKRRIKEATRVVLAESGWKMNGSVIQKEAGKEEKKRRPKEQLTGTLCYFPGYEVVSAPWDSLVKDVGHGIKRFLMEKGLAEKGQTMYRRRREDGREREEGLGEGQGQRYRSPFYAKGKVWKSKTPSEGTESGERRVNLVRSVPSSRPPQGQQKGHAI
jgi:RNase P protein component